MSHHRACCCVRWSIIHKLDADGHVLWSVWPTCVPYPTQARCVILLWAGARLLAHIHAQDGVTGWICEIDTSTGETGAWAATAAYRHLQWDGTHLWGARSIGGPAYTGALDRLDGSTFGVIGSSLWDTKSSTEAGPHAPVYGQPVDGLWVTPAYAYTGGTDVLSYASRLDLAAWPPSTETGREPAGPTWRWATAPYYVHLGDGVFQGPIARVTFDFNSTWGTWDTILADDWINGADNLGGGAGFIGAWAANTAVSDDYVITVLTATFADGTVYRTPRAGTGVQAATTLYTGGRFVPGPWGLALSPAGDRIYLPFRSDGAGHPAFIAIATADGTTAWSVTWPRMRAGGQQSSNAVVVSDIGIVYLGSDPAAGHLLEE